MRDWISATRPWPMAAAVGAAVALAVLSGWVLYWRWVHSLDGGASTGVALAGASSAAVFALTITWARRTPPDTR